MPSHASRSGFSHPPIAFTRLRPLSPSPKLQDAKKGLAAVSPSSAITATISPAPGRAESAKKADYFKGADDLEDQDIAILVAFLADDSDNDGDNDSVGRDHHSHSDNACDDNIDIRDRSSKNHDKGNNNAEDGEDMDNNDAHGYVVCSDGCLSIVEKLLCGSIRAQSL